MVPGQNVVYGPDAVVAKCVVTDDDAGSVDSAMGKGGIQTGWPAADDDGVVDLSHVVQDSSQARRTGCHAQQAGALRRKRGSLGARSSHV